MNQAYIQHMTGKVIIGDLDMSADGEQLVMPVVSIGNISAPKKGKKNHSIDLRLYLSDEATKHEGRRDCSWLVPGAPECAIEDIQVVVSFKPGTFDLGRIEATPDEAPR